MVWETTTDTASPYTLTAVAKSFNTAFGTGGTDLFDAHFINQDAPGEYMHATCHLSAAAVLVVDTVIEGSNGTSEVAWSPGTIDVTNDVPASKQVTTEGNKTLTGGFAATTHDAGTKSSGTFTPDEADGNLQKAVNGGAHTLAPPTNDCSIVIQYTNNASAGAITTSGFTRVAGDTITTTDGHDFLFYITKINGFSLLTVVKLQ
jgi:hypothetical protein